MLTELIYLVALMSWLALQAAGDSAGYRRAGRRCDNSPAGGHSGVGGSPHAPPGSGRASRWLAPTRPSDRPWVAPLTRACARGTTARAAAHSARRGVAQCGPTRAPAPRRTAGSAIPLRVPCPPVRPADEPCAPRMLSDRRLPEPTQADAPHETEVARLLRAATCRQTTRD